MQGLKLDLEIMVLGRIGLRRKLVSVLIDEKHTANEDYCRNHILLVHEEGCKNKFKFPKAVNVRWRQMRLLVGECTRHPIENV